jgi:hypothetical protein
MRSPVQSSRRSFGRSSRKHDNARAPKTAHVRGSPRLHGRRRHPRLRELPATRAVAEHLPCVHGRCKPPPTAWPRACTSGISGSPPKGSGVASLSSCGPNPPARSRLSSPGAGGCGPMAFGPQGADATGQYTQIGGGGARSRGSGHQAAWHTRLVGVVSRPGAAKQRVLITLKGRPNGVFVLTPLEPRGAQARLGDAALLWDGVAPSPGRDSKGSRVSPPASSSRSSIRS